MTKTELLNALHFGFVDIWSPSCADWIRADKDYFAEWLSNSCPAERMFKAEIVGMVVRIG